MNAFRDDRASDLTPIQPPHNAYRCPAHLPLVSIVVTNFNYGRYIRFAIESARHQTYPRVEIVVIDDASTDGSGRATADWANELGDNRVRVLIIAQNVGQMGAIRAGLENSSGQFVVLLDADDALMPEFVERHVMAHLNGTFSAGLSASDTVQIDQDGALLEGTYCSHKKYRGDVDGPVRPILSSAVATLRGDRVEFGGPADRSIYFVDRTLAGWHGVAMSAFMWRRNLLDLIMPQVTEPFRICADYYLALYGHALTGTLTLWDRLSYFRFHQQNGFSKNAVLGGAWITGTFDPALKEAIEHQIAVHIAENYDRLDKAMGGQAFATFHRYCRATERAALLQMCPALTPPPAPPLSLKRRKKWYKLLPNKKWVPGGLRNR